ncbi:TIR domain-containing protein [Candidatus Izemoplasma sp. B36]|uniref:TIR domain-containing protein n=1 Tax=Candidatus Izemoplasma sp. B36 TaxID=3242468 RepID=UPI0035585D49
MAKKKAFISFDYDYDLEIKNALVAQAENDDSPFEIRDLSIQEAIDSNWKKFARRRIKNCDLMIVLCGKHTDKARGVSAELLIAQEERIPYFLLAGRKNTSVKPTGVYKTDKLYRWTWDNVKILIDGGR